MNLYMLAQLVSHWSRMQAIRVRILAGVTVNYDPGNYDLKVIISQEIMTFGVLIYREIKSELVNYDS